MTANLNKPQIKLTPEERSYVIKFLKETESGVFDAVKNLSDTQINFTPAADKWSIEECVKHLALSESEFWAMAEAALKQAPNAERRSQIVFSDRELINAVEDRSRKSKTFAALEPANSPYKTLNQAIASFKNNREKLIEFIETTQQDLRSHVLELPIGTYDTYQFVLLIAAHTNRHIQQIEEVKASLNFPKN